MFEAFKVLTKGTLYYGKVLSWKGRTKRRRNFCSSLVATCIFTRRFLTPIRWFELEFMFGMSSQALSEIFWQLLHDFNPMYETLIQLLRMILVQNGVRMYADCISESGAPLPNCLGFMDGTKIFMSRPGGPNANQRSRYMEHKRLHCLIYLAITTPDGLILYLYGSEVGPRHDMMLYGHSGLDEALEKHLVIDGFQYTFKVSQRSLCDNTFTSHFKSQLLFWGRLYSTQQ